MFKREAACLGGSCLVWESEKERTSLPCCQGSRELETKDTDDLGSGAASHATGGKEQPIQERQQNSANLV